MKNNREMLKEAIAEARTVKETAIANAKLALEETITPKLKSMLAKRLEEMEVEDELEEANFNLTQTSFQLNEEVQMKDTYKAKYEDAKKETQDYKTISEHKDSIISTQREVNKIFNLFLFLIFRRLKCMKKRLLNIGN